MKTALLIKQGKPLGDEVVNYCREKFSDLEVYSGSVGDVFPKELRTTSFDLLISYLSPWIVPGDVLARTSGYAVNFHPAPPTYPGIGCFNFALYDKAATFGATAHIMEKKVDTGRIIGVKRFAISPTDSVYSLSVKTYAHLFSLFTEVIDHLVEQGEPPACNENWSRAPYRRSELEALCRIDLSMDQVEAARRIRAVTYPGMPGAYVELHGYRFEYNPKR